jgi:hypothetical protein
MEKSIMKKYLLSLVLISFCFFIASCNYNSKSANSEDVTLSSLCEKYTSDKCPKGHNFTEVYELFFHPIKDNAKKIMEIGIAQGASLNLWRNYFPNATIYGVDIFDMSKFDSNYIKTFIGNQSKREDLQKFISRYGDNFDIILDDGGHTMEQQQISLGFLFKHIKPGGYYIIEDVHSSLQINKKEFWPAEDETTTTLAMLVNFIKTKSIQSKYLTDAEITYLNRSVEFCNLFMNNRQFDSMTCILKKRL